MKTIDYKTIERYAKRLEKKNLKEKGQSLSWGSMLRGVKVHESFVENNDVVVDNNWKEQMQNYITSRD